MENRKNSLSVLKICRFCLSQDDTLTCIYDRNMKPKNSICLSLKILSCLSVEVFPSDRLPAYICKPCLFFIELFYKYKDICRKADESIMMHLQSGSSLEQMTWPSLLTKVFRVASKPGPLNTVVEGATVQVTSQDGSDSEDEDEANIYNIKIGDESGDGSKRIKVITSSKEEKEKPKGSKGRQEFTAISKLTRHVRSHAGVRSYPCKYCKKTFIKSHHYTRHLRMKHRQAGRPLAEANTEHYRCEQCSEPFESQDELIYHSAIHATQNLTCPLCQEKFDDVDAVTAHIKSHVNGMEFMCDLCELVFTSKEKLDKHLNAAHAEELDLDDSSMEVEGEEDDDETGINVTEEDGEMVVEIKKTDNFMLPEAQTSTEERLDNTIFEDNSETETTYTELATVDPLVLANKTPIKTEPEVTPMVMGTATLTKVNSKSVEPADGQTPPILRKAEEVKRKVQQITEPLPEKKEKVMKVESSNSVGASDKSLRLLEKELQELKRTNTRNEVAKTPAKPMESLRNRRPQLHTSTPKTRVVEQKKELSSTKTPAVEKKVPERRTVTKENKEPKEVKDTKAITTAVKEEKIIKEEKKEETKEKDTPKSVVKNGTNEKSQPEENVRRSTRPSKIKDYAKMIRDKSQESDDDSDDGEDEEYKEVEKTETRAKTRRGSIKQPAGKAAAASPAAPAPAATPATPAARKRGRPRKDLPKEVPAKMKKQDVEEDEEEKETDKNEAEQTSKKSTTPLVKEKQTEENSEESEPVDTETAANDANKSTPDQKTSPSKLLMSPSGQTLKKVPIKALPPGIKPLPLPAHARPMGPGELCEMQIGKKVVKVQKIVMTKAEVEAMAKKGLVEMKDGTMVLKQGIKLPTSDLSLSSLVPTLGDKGASKESLKTEKVSNAQNNASE